MYTVHIVNNVIINFKLYLLGDTQRPSLVGKGHQQNKFSSNLLAAQRLFGYGGLVVSMRALSPKKYRKAKKAKFNGHFLRMLHLIKGLMWARSSMG